ncbi:hypothetical protein CPK_ORF00397 [Chlamydia pneumoniae LPCoLN]|nr:hypothetical protein CPK_ORF00397 [Chlamydia pneumoniae LPCoLN]
MAARALLEGTSIHPWLVLKELVDEGNNISSKYFITCE